jgi:hypothetical protein
MRRAVDATAQVFASEAVADIAKSIPATLARRKIEEAWFTGLSC